VEVITYQLIVVATIWAAYRVSPRVGFWAAVAWSAETLILLFFPPLIFIQLVVVWGTYFVLNSNAAKTRRIDQLEQQLRDHPLATRERLRTLDPTHLEFISGREHQRLLHQGIQASRDQLCVLSGWISHKVVDSVFLGELESALMRGVSVFLAYGFEDSQGTHSESRTTKQALSSLRGLQQKSERYGYRGKLHVGKFPNHEKILVKDHNFVVCGSNNWLSNTRFRNSERSVVVRHPDFARAEGERVAKLVSEHPVPRF
jgi:phosphatidylserine/phosphatidylglycerophosphate/cardiolipin synthase-like enzyme